MTIIEINKQTPSLCIIKVDIYYDCANVMTISKLTFIWCRDAMPRDH
jgi:hypothetical protein